MGEAISDASDHNLGRADKRSQGNLQGLQPWVFFSVCASRRAGPGSREPSRGASRPCGFDPSRKSTSCPLGQKRKTGPLCSSHLHKGPALSYLAAIPNGCKGRFRSFGRFRFASGLRPGGGNLSVADTTTSFSWKSSLPPSWWPPSRSSLPSSLSWPCRPL